MNLLAPYGYRLTGRVFNASPTYELAAPGSPTAGPERLPTVHPILDAAWVSEDPALEVARTAAGLRVTSTLPADAKAHVTQHAINVRRAPEADLIEIAPSTTYFLQATGQASAGLGVAMMVIEYDDHGRLGTHRVYFHPRLFQQVPLSPGTRRVRVSIRLSGAGELALDGLALHALAGRAPVGVAAAVAAHAVPGAVIVDRTSAEAQLHDELAGLGAPVVTEVGDAPVAVVVQDLPRLLSAGRAARGPVALDAELAPRVVHVLLCDDVFTILDRGLLAQAARAGWSLVAAHPTGAPRLPIALAFAHQRSTDAAAEAEALALGNERRFAELVRALGDQRTRTATPGAPRSWRDRFGRALDSLRGDDPKA